MNRALAQRNDAQEFAGYIVVVMHRRASIGARADMKNRTGGTYEADAWWTESFAGLLER